MPVKPLSVNAAWQGRRFKTKEHKQFEKIVQTILRAHPFQRFEGPYFVRYLFALKNASRTDTSNLIKVLEDNLVKAGIISDDRKVDCLLAEKIPADDDWVEIEVLPINEAGNIR